jgi:alpha-beta hydrolase superfamily lysophospholipase
MTKRLTIALASLLLLGCAYALLVAVPLEAIKPVHVPLTTNPGDVGLDYEDFTVSPADAALTLHGWWMPAGDAHATLVFLHGGGSHRHSKFFGALAFYRALVEAGVSVAAIDLRNHGLSGEDGAGLQFGRTEMHDAVAALDWARDRAPGSPLYLMGISMGGATAIHAAHAGARVDGLILLDPLLDTYDTFLRGGVAQSGLPAAVFAPAAWSAMQFFGLPAGPDTALERGAALELPILLIQDPDDPVTRKPFATELAQRNLRVNLWLAPPIDPDHPDLAWKGRWGSHVSAFLFYPDQTLARIIQFMQATS